MQKTFVRMATYSDSYPATPGPLVHTPPLFHKLKVLTIFDIYKLQLGKLIYESVNDIGPTIVIKYTRDLRFIDIILDMLIMVTYIQIVFKLLVSDLRDYKHKLNSYGKFYQTKSKTVEQKNHSLKVLNNTLLHHTCNNK